MEVIVYIIQFYTHLEFQYYLSIEMTSSYRPLLDSTYSLLDMHSRYSMNR